MSRPGNEQGSDGVSRAWRNLAASWRYFVHAILELLKAFIGLSRASLRLALRKPWALGGVFVAILGAVGDGIAIYKLLFEEPSTPTAPPVPSETPGLQPKASPSPGPTVPSNTPQPTASLAHPTPISSPVISPTPTVERRATNTPTPNTGRCSNSHADSHVNSYAHKYSKSDANTYPRPHTGRYTRSQPNALLGLGDR